MDPSDYLNTDPSRLRVIDLKRAITEFGGVPEERATKATLIKQFAQLRSNYLRTVSGGPRSRPQSESFDIGGFVDAIDEQLVAVNQNLNYSKVGRGDLTQSAFDFTGAFNDHALHEQLARENEVDAAKPVSPLRRMKNPYGVERTPGERKDSIASLPFTGSSKSDGKSQIEKSKTNLTVSPVDQEIVKSVLRKSSYIDKSKDKHSSSQTQVHAEMKHNSKNVTKKHKSSEKHRSKSKEKRIKSQKELCTSGSTRQLSTSTPTIKIEAPANPYPHIGSTHTPREALHTTYGRAQLERSVHSHRGSIMQDPDRNLTNSSTKKHSMLPQKTQSLWKSKQYEDEHSAYNFKTTIHSHPTLVRLAFIAVLLVISYQLFSLASDPVKPQIPIISHVISVLFACIFSGPVYTETLTHTSAQYGITEPCPTFGTCSGGLLVSCIPGYQKAPFNNSFYPQVSFASTRNFFSAIGNNAMARWMPGAYKHISDTASHSPDFSSDDNYSLSQVQYSYGFMTHAPVLRRRMRCQRASGVTTKLSSLLQSLDNELQAYKGSLFCRSRGRKITLDTSLPLLKTRTINRFLRRNSLIFSVVNQTSTNGIFSADSLKDLVTTYTDILQNDVLEALTQAILQEGTDNEVYLPPNIKFRLPAEPGDIQNVVQCDSNDSFQDCMHKRYIYILSNANVFTHSLPRFSLECKFKFWFHRDPAAALGKILQCMVFVAGSLYIVIKIGVYIIAGHIAKRIKTYLHDYKVDMLQVAKPGDTKLPGFAAVTLVQLRDLFLANYPRVIRLILWKKVLKNIHTDSRITITSSIDLTGRIAEFAVWNGLLLSSSFGNDAPIVGRHFKNHVTPVSLPPPSEDNE
ncbi:Protein 21.6 [Giardia lamblia P15]|uniref:Protein 21.6 n=1 Tax=Giardia intestinalis (strain P15) TaxID=658858 RepID=E1F2K4_GIAIA|nr:Protein 21.6 [Giardia lamblia P15]